MMVIPMNDAWELNDDKRKFEVAQTICEAFSLGKFTKRRMFEIITFLEDGLDELVLAKPRMIVTPVIGEGLITWGGEKNSFDVREILGAAGIINADN